MHVTAVALEVRRETHHAHPLAHDPGERRLSLEERPLERIFPVEVEEVEGEIDELAPAGGKRVLQGLEARPPVGQDGRDLAIEERGPDLQLPRGGGYLRELRGPVLATSAPERDLASLDRAADPIAVVLHLVHPPVARWRLGDEQRELGPVGWDGSPGGHG